MIELKKVVERLGLETSEIASIIYRNDDMGIGNRRFKHIDVEMTYGEYIELVESDSLYQEIYEQEKLSEVKDIEEGILYQLQQSEQEGEKGCS